MNICAGIVNGKIMTWHELPATWNAEVAEGLYRGPLVDILIAERGRKRRMQILISLGHAASKSSATTLNSLKISTLACGKAWFLS